MFRAVVSASGSEGRYRGPCTGAVRPVSGASRMSGSSSCAKTMILKAAARNSRIGVLSNSASSAGTGKYQKWPWQNPRPFPGRRRHQGMHLHTPTGGAKGRRARCRRPPGRVLRGSPPLEAVCRSSSEAASPSECRKSPSPTGRVGWRLVRGRAVDKGRASRSDPACSLLGRTRGAHTMTDMCGREPRRQASL